MKALFDTNILVDYLQGIESARVELDRHDQQLISAISWMEVMIGASAEEVARIRAFLAGFAIVPVNEAVMETAVAIRRDTRLKLPDAIIWASAKVEYAMLVSRDERAFPSDVPEIRVPYRLHDGDA